MNKNISKGFTLIEMMIVVAILGIITAIALPSYSEQVKKGKRTDAKVELLRIAQLQESYFVQNLSYAKDLRSGPGGLGLGTNVKSEQGVYAITMTATDSAGGTCTGLPADSCVAFLITATPLGGQASDKCRILTISNTGLKGAPVAVSGYDAGRCWK